MADRREAVRREPALAFAALPPHAHERVVARGLLLLRATGRSAAARAGAAAHAAARAPAEVRPDRRGEVPGNHTV